jgi:hypothetical protein
VRALAAIVVDHALATPITDLLPAPELTGRIRAALGEAAERPDLRAAVNDAVAAARSKAQGDGRALRELLLPGVEPAVREALALRWSPSEDLVLRIINQPAMRELVASVLSETLHGFTARLKSADKGLLGGLGERTARRGSGLFGALAGGISEAAGGIVGAVRDELGSAMETKVREFVESATEQAVRGIAAWLAEPQHADRLAVMRAGVLDVVLALTVREVAQEVEELDTAAITERVLAALRDMARDPAAEAPPHARGGGGPRPPARPHPRRPRRPLRPRHAGPRAHRRLAGAAAHLARQLRALRSVVAGHPHGGRNVIVGLVASALAGWVAVAPQQGDGPETTLESKLPLVLTWEGGVADIELRVGTRWKVVDRAVTSPYTTKPLPIASALRVSGSNGVIGVAIPDGVWTPSDLAAWSGDGLRGAAIGGIAGTPEALWVGTLGGGLSMWDGARWRHIDRRDGLPSLHIHSVALDGGDRWIGHGEGATRIRADGSLTHWWIDRGGGWDVRPADRGGAWAATQAGIVRLDERGVSTVIADPSCWRLLTHPDAGTVASCGTRVLRVPDASPLPELAADTAVIGLVPRADGVWVARPDRLDTLIQGTMHPWWAPDDDGAVLQSLIQLGGGLFVTASTGQGVPGWRITEAGASPLLPADGVQAGDGLLAAPGPRSDKIWLGSTRGVALVSEQGAGTPLPNAPLPAGPQGARCPTDQRLPRRGRGGGPRVDWGGRSERLVQPRSRRRRPRPRCGL